MKDSAKQLGWTLAVWGIFSVLFGLIILAWPAITLKAFLLVLGIYFVASGLVVGIGSLIHKTDRWAGGMVLGLLSVVAGLFVLANPQLSGTVILYLIALWAVVMGAVLMVSGVETGKSGIWMTLAGLVAVFFGFYTFMNPEEGAVAIVWLIGVYNLVVGMLMIVASFNTKKLAKELPDWN